MRERRKNMQKMRLTKVSLYSNIITTADRDKSPCILLPSPPFHVFFANWRKIFSGIISRVTAGQRSLCNAYHQDGEKDRDFYGR